MKSEFPEGVVVFQLSADIDPDLFGGGLCTAGDVDYDLAELLDAGDGYIATARPALIQLLDDLSAIVRSDSPDDAPVSALVEGWDPEEDQTPLGNPGLYKVPEVLEALADATPEQVAATLELERAGRERSGILSYEPPAPDQGEADGSAEANGDGLAE